MQFKNIKDICSSLMRKAKESNFLQLAANEIEPEANCFVDEFSKEHEMTAHTISPYRWYFQSNTRMFNDGVIELQCRTRLRKKNGSCAFNFVDVSLSKITQKRN
jgi:hypothetical protein